MANSDGGPAYPIVVGGAIVQRGMSLRDAIAIQSIAGTVWQGGDRMNDEQIAADAYRLADAMLKARQR